MKIIVTAGGTGGHIFPALAIAMEIRKVLPASEILWIGTSRSREAKLCQKHGIRLTIVDVVGFKRSLQLSNIAAVIKFFVAIFRMIALMKREKPDAVIAFGGYVCAPVLCAARLGFVPYFIQEQNSVMGLVNRLFASGAQQIFLGMPLVGTQRNRTRTMLTGTPVRTPQTTYDDQSYPAGFNQSSTTIFVTGGSQGAASMNEYLIAPVKKFLSSGYQVVWQTGDVSFSKIKEVLSEFPRAFIMASISDMYPFYATARMIICRAGASTLSEVACFGIPCLMIPLPWAAENHQWENAGYIESKGWGVRIAQDQNCSMNIEKETVRIVTEQKIWERMNAAARAHGVAQAAETITGQILKSVKSYDSGK